MGDWIRENKYTASVLTSLLVFLIAMLAIVKPYIDRGDSSNKKRIEANNAEYVNMLNQTLSLQKQISEDLKKLVYKQDSVSASSIRKCKK